MVQFFERGPSRTGLQSQILGEGIGQVAGAYGGQKIKQSQLQQAFQRMREGPQDYLSQLEAIAPSLMTTPGGAQLLGELAPILQKGAQSESTARVIERKLQEANAKVMQGQDLSSPSELPTTIDEKIKDAKKTEAQEMIPRGKEKRGRTGQPPQSEEQLFPEKTVGPKIQRPMSPPELEKYKLELMNTSKEMGTPIDYKQASEIADKQNESINNFNEKIQKEQELTAQHIEKMSADVVARAKNSGLIEENSPQDVAIAEKLGYEARNAETPEKRWQYVKQGMEKYNTAKEGLRRQGSPPGPIGKAYQKLVGTYRDKQTIIDSTQPFLDTYRELNLIPEAREELMNSVGLGAEDAETALFPFTKKEKQELQSFPKNKIQPKFISSEAPFPGENYRLPEEEYMKFKDQLADYIGKNEDVNLVALRGYINQDRRYSWQDYAKALSELQEEGRFIPDNNQFQQIPIIQQAPLPGLAQIFKYEFTGTK